MRGKPADFRIKALSSLDSATGCWMWIGGVDKDGYGALTFNNKRVRAHRLSHETFNGPLLDGQLVLHKCDTPGCVNPPHLYAGNQLDNESDKRERGRGPAGEANVKAKLTVSEIQQIQDLYSSGLFSGAAIGRLYEISKSNACRIVKGKLWSNVK